MERKIEIKLVRSIAGTPQWMRVVVRTLGLRKLNSSRVLTDNGSIRGMVKRVPHLVSLREVQE
jgi:large subunit ribosomal protein L30